MEAPDQSKEKDPINLLEWNGAKSFEKRRGLVTVSIEFMDHVSPYILKLFFERFWPFSIVLNNANRSITYAGFSPHFDELGDQEALPTYEINFNKDPETDTWSFDSCTRIKPKS